MDALPCQSVTTACAPKVKAKKNPLPGPRRKQAHALTENIKWLEATCGRERIGFLTLTLGDLDAGGRYRNLRNRKEAQRRFHSLLTNVIAKRYACGVIVTERHRNGGIHYHLAVVCADDIRGELDFEACFPRKNGFGRPVHRPDYSTATDAIKREWAFWRRVAKFYGFGRHQLQPMRKNGEALGRYMGKHLSKDWKHRLPEDKGARSLRYFGHWSKTARMKGERRKGRPHGSSFGLTTPRARGWREAVRQTVTVLNSKGAALSYESMKNQLGPKWAWKITRLFEFVRFEVCDCQDKELQDAIREHNSEVATRWLSIGGRRKGSCGWQVTQITLDHLRLSPQSIMLGEDLELAKECATGLATAATRGRNEAKKLRLLRQVAVEFELTDTMNLSAGSQNQSH